MDKKDDFLVKKNLVEDKLNYVEKKCDDNSCEVAIIESELCEDNIVLQKKRVFHRYFNYKKIFLVCGLILYMAITIVTTIKYYESRVYPGVKVCGVDVSELNNNELKSKLKTIVKNLDNRVLLINASDKKYNINISGLVDDYYIDKLSKKVINYGKNNELITRFIYASRNNNINYVIDLKINDKRLNKLIAQIKEDTNIESVNPKIEITDSHVNLRQGINGKELMENDFKSELINFTSNMKDNNSNIKINARYNEKMPEISINELKKVDTKIASYATKYKVDESRNKNIEIAAQKLDNLVIMPNEEFSYEKTIGPVDIVNGYTNAPVIIDNEIKEGIGGGVCQVSSTLYNTTLIAGILPSERRNHSKVVGYVPKGLDATFASGLIDYKFINNYEYPIVINTLVSNGLLTIEMWSNKNAKQGIEYEAKSYINGNIANTYIYGYDKERNKIYEKHIDQSKYK